MHIISEDILQNTSFWCRIHVCNMQGDWIEYVFSPLRYLIELAHCNYRGFVVLCGLKRLHALLIMMILVCFVHKILHLTFSTYAVYVL